MALEYVLSQVGFKVGLSPSVDGDRKVLLRVVNEAAKELYQQSDMAGCLEEQYFKINSDQTISLPEYVGQLRAMREADSQIAIKLSQMRPRYNQFNWADGWRNWRLKGLQTLQNPLINEAQLILKVKAVETPNVSVTITGSVSGASRKSETVVMDSIEKQTTNAFTDIASITKSTYTEYDVIINDIDDNRLSFIPNNRLRAQFQVIDISTAPWLPNNINALLGWVEVLYKKALPQYSNDTDEFPAVGYDDVWVNKCLQLFYEEQGNAALAISYYQKATQSLAQIHEDANRGTDDMVAMVANPHDEINPRVGFGRDWRYAYRITGR